MCFYGCKSLQTVIFERIGPESLIRVSASSLDIPKRIVELCETCFYENVGDYGEFHLAYHSSLSVTVMKDYLVLVSNWHSGLLF